MPGTKGETLSCCKPLETTSHPGPMCSENQGDNGIGPQLGAPSYPRQLTQLTEFSQQI